MRYALKDKNRLNFSCVSKTVSEFDTKIQRAYWNWRGVQSKNSSQSIEDFLKDYVKVKLTIEPYES